MKGRGGWKRRGRSGEEGGKEGEKRGGEGKKGKKEEGKNDLTHPLSQIPGYATYFHAIVNDKRLA